MPKPKKDLEIYNVQTDEEPDPRFEDLDPRLPKPPFVMSFQADCASGKTVAMVNLLYNENFYRDKFDSVFIFSPSINNDLVWQTAVNDDRVVKITGEQLDRADQVINGLWLAQTQRVEKALADKVPPPHMLLIFDDCLGKLGKEFALLCTRYRHPRITIMVSCQYFRKLPIETRINASEYLIWGTSSETELRKMVEEFAGNFGETKFLECYNKATAEPYNFLYVQKYKRKLSHNFTDLLYDAYVSEPNAKPTGPSNKEES